MRETRQEAVLEEIAHFISKVYDVDDHGNQIIRKEVKPPEHLTKAIEIAIDLYEEAEARRAITRELSEAELACLKGITLGLNRASNAKFDEPKDSNPNG